MSDDQGKHQPHIRRAVHGDASAMRSILWKTWIATYCTFIPEDDIRSYFEEHYSEAAIGELLREPEVEAYIAERDSTAAGVMITRRNQSENRFYVSSLYVLPESQGRGLGKALLKFAAGRAAAVGMNRLWLGVMAPNVQALAWYRAYGFSFGEELPFRMGKTTVPHLIGSVELRMPVV